LDKEVFGQLHEVGHPRFQDALAAAVEELAGVEAQGAVLFAKAGASVL